MPAQRIFTRLSCRPISNSSASICAPRRTSGRAGNAASSTWMATWARRWGRCLWSARSALDGSEDAHQVAAQNLAHVVRRVATSQQRGGDLGQVGGGVDALGQCGDAVEVGANADGIDTRDPEDVVEVVDQRLERRAGHPRGELAVKLVGDVVGNGLALGGVLGGEGIISSAERGPLDRKRVV